jgi:hypothetical protein
MNLLHYPASSNNLFPPNGGKRHIDSRNSTMVTSSDFGTTPSVWGAGASITNGCKARGRYCRRLVDCLHAGGAGAAASCGAAAKWAIGGLQSRGVGSSEAAEQLALASHRVPT